MAREQIAADRRAEQLGDLPQVVRAAVGVHLAARDDHRQARGGEQIRGAPDGVRIGMQRGVGFRARARQNLGALDPLLPEILRERDEGRAAGRHAREEERAPQHLGDRVGAQDVPRPACVVPRQLRQIRRLEEDVLAARGRRLSAGGDHDRHAVAERVRDLSERVGGAGVRVHLHERGLSRGARVPVGHRHDGALVKALDVLQLDAIDEGVEEADLLGSGEPEDVGDVPVDQELGHHLAAGRVVEHASCRGAGRRRRLPRVERPRQAGRRARRHAGLGEPGHEAAARHPAFEKQAAPRLSWLRGF